MEERRCESCMKNTANPVMGRGGLAYLRYNYDDTGWASYVASCGGDIDYT